MKAADRAAVKEIMAAREAAAAAEAAEDEAALARAANARVFCPPLVR